jgi:hypothetical protein
MQGSARGAAYGIPTPPANSAQVGAALAGQAQQPMMGAPGMAPGLLPSLGIAPLMDTGMHSRASTDAAMAEAERRMAGSPERSTHTQRSPMAGWQLAALGIPPLEIDLDALSSGQPEMMDEDYD